MNQVDSADESRVGTQARVSRLACDHGRSQFFQSKLCRVQHAKICDKDFDIGESNTRFTYRYLEQ